MRAGDASAREELLECACLRLKQLASNMFRGYSRVRRWEETDDVFSSAMLRLHRSLESVTPESPLHFFRLAALQIRRELKDLARKYYGQYGLGAKHASQLNDADGSQELKRSEPVEKTNDPQSLAVWSELHSEVEKLPEAEREVFDLVWYHQLSQVEVAEMLNVSRRTVIRRWQAACLKLHGVLFSEKNLSHSSSSVRKDKDNDL